MLGLSSSALILGAAGCLGDDDGGDDADDVGDGNGDDGADDSGDDSDNGGSGPPLEEEMVHYTNRFPDEDNHNAHVPDATSTAWAHHIIFGTFAAPNANAEYELVLGADWDIPEFLEEGDTFTLTLRDDLYYHDGVRMDAERFADSIYNQTVMQEHGSISGIDVFGDPEVVDETTISLTANQAMSGSILRDEVWRLDGHFGNDQNRPWTEALRDATSEDAVAEVAADYLDESWDMEYGAGPFMLGETSSDFQMLERFEDYPEEFRTNVERIRIQNFGAEYLRAMQTGQLDVHVWTDARLLSDSNWASDQDPAVRNVTPSGGGWFLAFDVSDDIIGNRMVRKALAHALNRWSVNQDQLPPGLSADLAEEYGLATTVSHPTNLGPNEIEFYLGDRLDDYETYGYGYDPDQMVESEQRAVEILEDEGFSLDDGLWFTPDGERWTMEVESPPAFVPWGESVAAQLRRFGIETAFRGYDPATFWGERANVNQGSVPFDLRMIIWGNVNNQAIYSSFGPQAGIFAHQLTRLDAAHGVGHWQDDDYQILIEVPYPIGDPEGSLEEIDFVEKTESLRLAKDEQEEIEIVQELAWIHNQFLNGIPTNQNSNQVYFTQDVWEWPEEGSPYDRSFNGDAGGIPWTKGEVRAKTE